MENNEKDEVRKAIDELIENEMNLTSKQEIRSEDDNNMPSENMPVGVDVSEDLNEDKTFEQPLFNVNDNDLENSTLYDEVGTQPNLPEDVENEITEEKTDLKTKMYFSYNMRLLLKIFGVFIFIILAIILFISSISIKARSSVLYRQTSNLDYRVYLKPNDYYSEPYLQKNMQYIASLIDSVGVDFNYNFSVNQNINYKYTYYVKADVSVADTQDKSKIIYSKSDKLTEPTTLIKKNSSEFNIVQSVKINYAEYNDLVKAFKSSYGISANSNLILSLCLEIEDEKGSKIRSIDSADTMKIIIPLTEQMLDITMDYKEINNSDNVSIYKDFSISNKVMFALSILSLILAIIFIIRLFIFIKKTTVKKTIYDITLSKILREYDRVIVNSKKIIDLNDDVVDVNSFNELLDVRDNLEKPIIFSEIHKGQKSIFIVKTPNETYRYILKLADLQRKQQNEK